MLLPAKMMDVSILVHMDVVDKLIKKLQKESIVEVKDISFQKDLKKILKQGEVGEYTQTLSSLEYRIEKILDIFERVKDSEKESIKKMLFPPAPIKYNTTEKDVETLIKNSEAALSEIENSVLKIENEIIDITESSEKQKVQRTQVEKLANLPFDVSHLGISEYMRIRAGVVKDIGSLISVLEDEAILWYEELEESYVVVMLYSTKNKKSVDSKIRYVSFQDFELKEWKGNPSEVLTAMDKKDEEHKTKLKKLKEDLRLIKKDWDEKFLILRDDISNEKKRNEIKKTFGNTESTATISCWVLKNKIDELEEMADTITEGSAVVMKKDAEGEDVPIKYNNPKIFRPYEMFIDMFAPPTYGKIEPTVIIAPLFILYFGLTLGDAGYGLLVFLAGFILLKGMGKYDKSMNTMGQILAVSGISAIIFGLIQGGFFGPLDAQTNNPFAIFLYDILGIQKITFLFDAMKDPITLLVIALIIGVFQLVLGLLCGVYQSLKAKDYNKFITDQLSWLILIPFGGIQIGRFFDWWETSSILSIIAWIMIFIGIALLLEIHNKKVNLLKLFDITGFIGNWLSYARLLALGLATAGIAMTINIFSDVLASFVQEGLTTTICCAVISIVGIVFILYLSKKKGKIVKYLGVLLLLMGGLGVINIQLALYLFLAIFLIVAHLGNSVLQSLGSFVHSLRLQYVEFFGMFYEAGGRNFAPFKEEREYTICEDIRGVE